MSAPSPACGAVNPARAGMIRLGELGELGHVRKPRASGDDPTLNLVPGYTPP